MTGPAAGAGDGSVSGGGTLHKQFDDNRLALQLFGAHHSHLARIEQQLDVSIHSRGNQLTIDGDPLAVTTAGTVLDRLYARIERGHPVRLSDVDAALRMAPEPGGSEAGGGRGDEDPAQSVVIRGRTVVTRTRTQGAYLRAIDRHDLVFGVGPAGTGKTYLAVAKAVERLVNGQVDRIILSRPAVEAGEQLGFLPGNMREKVDPYLRPLYDALYDMLPAPQVIKRLESSEIEVAPLAFMRGRTLANAFVILDEAQNTTAVQMKMFLTRLGENARMVITGDLSQVDLPKGTRSGLRQALEILAGVDGIGFVEFTDADVVRHPLVTRIVRAYERAEDRMRLGAEYERKDRERGRGRF
ncbi:MAG: PhoH family protein [Rhodospirillales bacterium]|nr:PhoH family protein [Rhodospirillales bacterium]